MGMNVFADDSAGFIDLGLDNVYEYTPDGDLLIEYDGTWLALNGHTVSSCLVSEDRDGDSHSIKGRVPVLLNDEAVDIMIVFDEQDPLRSCDRRPAAVRQRRRNRHGGQGTHRHRSW